MRTFFLEALEIREGSFNNRASDSESLWGTYFTFKSELTNFEIYYLGLKRLDAIFAFGVGDEKRHSFGTRVFGKNGNVDWNTEIVYQVGDIAHYDISAWTIVSLVGYRFQDLPGSSRLGLSTNVASGDKNPHDQKLNTFNPLFPNYGYFEEAGILAPQNFYNIEPEISFNLNPQMSISLDWDFSGVWKSRMQCTLRA